MKDICPIMSYRNGDIVECTDRCAWFDTDLMECAVSRLNGNTKRLKDIDIQLDAISNAIQQLDLTNKISGN